MDVIYQLTFFAALTILAILITIFVFAVSLLGRAMEVAAKAEKAKRAERKESIAKEMAVIKEEIDKAEASGQIPPTQLIQKLKKLSKEDKKSEKKIASIKEAPDLLTVEGGVAPTASLLLLALISSGMAWYFDTHNPISAPVFWILALFVMGCSIYRIYQCLRVIERVAITSEEAALMREIKAFKQALEEIEQEKKPELALKFSGEQPPFHIKPNAEMRLGLQLCLTKGDIAEYTVVHLLAPPGFDFPGRRPYVLTPSHSYANHIGTIWEIGIVIGGIDYNHTIAIKAPPEAGSFRLVGYAVCEGYKSKPVEGEVIVR